MRQPKTDRLTARNPRIAVSSQTGQVKTTSKPPKLVSVFSRVRQQNQYEESNEIIDMGMSNTTHPSPESCGGTREGATEALTGEDAGEPLSRERNVIRTADTVLDNGRQYGDRRKGESVAESARSKTLSMHRSFIYGN